MKKRMLMRINRYSIPILTVLVFMGSLSCNTAKIDLPQKPNYFPSEGLISDEETAIKIAEIVWIKHYGESIKYQKPFIAKLEKGIWHIEGNTEYMLKNKMVGGVAYIEISQYDCQILNISHSK